MGYKREYLQWDLDSAFGRLDANADMYNQATGRHDVYEKSLVEADDAPFRQEYNIIIKHLLDGPFDEARLIADLQSFEALLGPSLAADANSKEAADSFDTLAAYVSARITSMRSQLPNPAKITYLAIVSNNASCKFKLKLILVTAVKAVRCIL